MATITCQDCGAERTQCPRNTRYCKACRLLREVLYWAHKRRTCLKCRIPFAPLERGNYHCSGCDPGLPHRKLDCVLCREEGRRLLTGIPVCDQCLRAPVKRASLIAALERGQAQRRQEHHATT